MNQLFPYANIIAGALILIVGFIFHFIGQLISVFNWDLAMKLGLQEKKAPPEYKVYEHGIAMADVTLGWIYGIAGLGLIFMAPWAFKLAWVPGIILTYHSISFWFWTDNQKRAGHQLQTGFFRICWCLANLISGILAVLVAWNGC
jgi:hypothetical protein